MFDWDDIEEKDPLPDLCNDEELDPSAALLSPVFLGDQCFARGAELEDEVTCVRIGDVEMDVISDKRHSPLVPVLPPVRGVLSSLHSQHVLAALQWMMQKAQLKQDMFLLGEPGHLLRHTVIRFCDIFCREMEYVGITRDTNEADIKQRREIVNGHVKYVDSPVVRAALRGRVLVLEGIEKAERNVLPLLNNLLENREMALEDGRFLVAPERAKQLKTEFTSAQWSQHLIPVSPAFIVVALGLPGRGNPLDPPLRSRFTAYSVSAPLPSEELQSLAQSAPTVSLPRIENVVEVVGSLHRLIAGAGSTGISLNLPPFPQNGANGIVKLLELFPGLDLISAIGRCYPMELLRLDERSHQLATTAINGLRSRSGSRSDYHLVDLQYGNGRIAIGTFEHAADGETLDIRLLVGPRCIHTLQREPNATPCSEPVMDTAQQINSEQSAVDCLSNKELKAWLVERNVPHGDCFEKGDYVRRAHEHIVKQLAVRNVQRPCGFLGNSIAGLTLAPAQGGQLSAMLQDHAADLDICLVGEKGVGKSALIRAFASLLGYQCKTIFCYKDMTSRDLLQQRTTDPAGNTQWRDSPLVQAALQGELAVLDGVHRLSTGSLYATIARLVSDRAAVLPDGSHLVSSQRWAQLVALHAGDPQCLLGIRPVHPAFRIIATGELPGVKEPWLDDEILTLFHFHHVRPIGDEELLQLLDQNSAHRKIFVGLLKYGQAMRKAAAEDPNLTPLSLSLRVLLRISTHLTKRPGDVNGALARAFSACLRFLPLGSQDAANRWLLDSMKGAGVEVKALRHDIETGPSERERQKRREDLRQLENIAINARFGYGGAQVDRARERADKDYEEQHKRRMEALRGRAEAQLRKVEKDGAVTRQGQIEIKDVTCAVRTPEHPELVPNVTFVDIPQHIATLRDMLLDWSLGQHLLLVGNQGVGKNKLADRLLCLLKCEREYVQLHRDTTVQSLTLAPTLRGGVVVWEDSPLLRAVKLGRCLVVDEADKAPLEVVCVLKCLADDGELALLDGRTIVRSVDSRLQLSPLESEGLPSADGMQDKLVEMSNDFRLIVLANRPGFPFLGNDFYKVCGDVFSCHAIDNPDIESEVDLLKSVGPDVPGHLLVQLSLLFMELREMVELGQLTYPYSTRELVKVVAHLQNFPQDELESALAGIFAFDMVDLRKRQGLLGILKKHGIANSVDGENILTGQNHGDMNLKLEENRDKSKDITREDNPDGQNPPEINPDGPKHGQWDGGQHIGGNMFAGGSGGTGTAGLGGRWGPYRLDVGQELVFVPEHLKAGIDEKVKKQAQRMADEAFVKRLDEIRMSPHQAEEYAKLKRSVAAQIQEMKNALEGHEAKERERVWLRQQTHGELDDSRLVDGITGSRTIYQRRGEPDNSSFGASQKLLKRFSFVMDISGSMYTFNRIDRRLQRLMETVVFIFESFSGYDDKYDIRMVGHSGTGPEAERLAEWGIPPRTDLDRLSLVKRMEAHCQYCYPGDHTLEGTRMAIKEIARQPADERIVFVVSDADLQRYNIDVGEWDRILHCEPSVKAYVVMISNNYDEAERIKRIIAPGRAHVCADTASLAVTFKQILSDSILRDA